MKVFCGSSKRAARPPNINNPDISSTPTTAFNVDDKQNPSTQQQNNETLHSPKTKTGASDARNAPLTRATSALPSARETQRTTPAIAPNHVAASDPSKWRLNELPASSRLKDNESARRLNEHHSVISYNTSTDRTAKIDDFRIQHQDHECPLRPRPSKHFDCSSALDLEPYKKKSNKSHHNRCVLTPRQPVQHQPCRRRFSYQKHPPKHPVLDDCKRRDCKICVERRRQPYVPSGGATAQHHGSPSTTPLPSPHPQPTRASSEGTALLNSRHPYHSPPNAQNVTLTFNVLDRNNPTATQLYRNSSVSSAQNLDSPVSTSPHSTPAVRDFWKTPKGSWSYRRECMQGACDCCYRSGASCCYLFDKWRGVPGDFDNDPNALLHCDGTREKCDVSFPFHDSPYITCCCFQHFVNATSLSDCSRGCAYGYWKPSCTPLTPNAYPPTGVCSCILSDP